MSNKVLELAQRIGGKKSMAIEAYANALREIPIIVCDNAGLDSNSLVTDLRSSIANGNNESGIDI